MWQILHKRLILIALCTVHYALCIGQSDPTLVGMIVMYTEKAEKSLKAQEAAMALQTTGHIWAEEEWEKTTSLQREFNNYLDQFHTVICYAAQIYGFYHEISMLTDNISNLTSQLKKAPANAVALSLSAKRNQIIREVIYGSVNICNDIRQTCLSSTKMTESERLEVVFNIRPKLKMMNRKLRKLIRAVKYTTFGSVWLEIDDRYHSYRVDKDGIGKAAYKRWRAAGDIKPSGGSGIGDPVRPRPGVEINDSIQYIQ